MNCTAKAYEIEKVSDYKAGHLKKWRQNHTQCLCGRVYKNGNGYIIYPEGNWTPVTVCSLSCADFWILQQGE